MVNMIRNHISASENTSIQVVSRHDPHCALIHDDNPSQLGEAQWCNVHLADLVRSELVHRANYNNPH